MKGVYRDRGQWTPNLSVTAMPSCINIRDGPDISMYIELSVRLDVRLDIKNSVVYRNQYPLNMTSGRSVKMISEQ